MNTKAVFYGVLCAVLAFAALNWREPMQATHAAVFPNPPAGRFAPIPIENGPLRSSGVLDTETGCVWVVRQTHAESKESYEQIIGDASLSSMPYDAKEYVFPKLNADKTINWDKPRAELARITALCDRARIQALESTSAGR